MARAFESADGVSVLGQVVGDTLSTTDVVSSGELIATCATRNRVLPSTTLKDRVNSSQHLYNHQLANHGSNSHKEDRHGRARLQRRVEIACQLPSHIIVIGFHSVQIGSRLRDFSCLV